MLHAEGDNSVEDDLVASSDDAYARDEVRAFDDHAADVPSAAAPAVSSGQAGLKKLQAAVRKRSGSKAGGLPPSWASVLAQTVRVAPHEFAASGHKRHQTETDDSLSRDGSKDGGGAPASLPESGSFVISSGSGGPTDASLPRSRAQRFFAIREEGKFNGAVALLQGLCYVYHIFVIPYQLALVHSDKVVFNASYATGYVADVIVTLSLVFDMRWHVHRIGGWSRTLLFDSTFMARVLRLLVAIPSDAAFWFYDKRVVPYVRLLHIFGAFEHAIKLAGVLQRSPAVSYNKARVLQLLLLVCATSHYLACIFVFVSRDDTFLSSAPIELRREHYLDSPWLPDADQPGAPWKERPAFPLWLRAFYWSFMTLTTVGHVDKMDERYRGGNDFEVVLAIVIIIVAMFVYTFFIGNMTAMMLRANTAVEEHRLGLAQVERYLRRRRVPESLRRLCRTNMQNAFERGDVNDEKLLDKLPRSLRANVLRHINSRVLRRAPIFFRCDKALVAALCSVMRRVVFVAGEVIAREGEVIRELFFIESGRVLQAAPELGGADDEEDDEELDPKGQEGSVHSASTSGSRLLHAATFCNGHGGSSTRTASKGGVGAEPPPVAGSFTSYVSPAQRRRLSTAAVGSDMTSLKNHQSSPALLSTPPEATLGAAACAAATTAPDAEDGAATTTASANDPSGHSGLSSVSPPSASFSHPPPAQGGAQSGGGHGAPHDRRRGSVSSAYSALPNDADAFRAGIELTAAGTALGEVAFVFGVRQFGTLIARERTICLAMSRIDYKAIVGEFSGETTKVQGNVLEQVKTRGAMSHASAEELRDLIEQRKQSALFELLNAASDGEVDLVRTLLNDPESGVNLHVDESDYDKRTALHVAASEGQVSVVEALISCGADVDVTDRWGGTPLADAIRNGSSSCAKLLINARAHLGYDDGKMASVLCEYAKDGRKEAIVGLLNAGGTVNVTDYDKRTALHIAASEGNWQIAEVLLNAGGDINAKDRWGGTPLRDAVREGHTKVAVALKQRGGELALDEAAVSAELCEAARQGHLRVVEALMASGANINAADYDRRTALHLAASEGILPIVEAMVSQGAHVNAKDRWGGTPLRDAVREGHTKVAVALRQRGGELGLTEVEASGELCEAARAGKLHVVEALIATGAPIDAADYDRRTCLHLAASEGNLPIVEYLCDAGANINCEDRWRSTPLRDALREGHRKVAQSLHKRGAQVGTSGEVSLAKIDGELKAVLAAYE